MSVTNPPGFLQNAGSTHTAAQLRTYLAGLQAGVFSAASNLRSRGGIHPGLGAEFLVTETGSPSMAVLVGSGVASIPGTEASTQGNYLVCNDATVTLSVTAAHATLPRIDIVVFNVRDAFYSGSDNDSQLQVIAGTPASSPVAPTAPANSIIIAQIAVGAAVTTIVNANITDVRFYMAAAGGVINARTDAARPASGEINEGQLVYSMDVNKLYMWNGSFYDQISPPRTIIERGKRTTSSSTTTTSIGVLRLDDVPVKSGRLYRVQTSAVSLDSTVSNDTITGYVAYTTDGSTPTPGSSTLMSGNVEQSDAAQDEPITLNSTFVPGSDLDFSILLAVSRPSGTGNVSMFGSGGYPIELYIEDCGTDPGDTGTDI